LTQAFSRCLTEEGRVVCTVASVLIHSLLSLRRAAFARKNICLVSFVESYQHSTFPIYFLCLLLYCLYLYVHAILSFYPWTLDFRTWYRITDIVNEIVA